MIDKKSYKILKFIKKNSNVSVEDLKKKYGDFSKDNISFLQKNEYVINDIKGYLPATNGQLPIRTNKLRISPKGLAYLQELKVESRKYWFPIILSNLIAIAALIVSIYSIYLQLQ